MMSVSRRSSGADSRAFGEQLTRMAHRADGIADFVRDARGQAAERGELALLHALGHEAGVLEKNQRRARVRCRRAARSAVGSPARRRRRRSSTARPRALRLAPGAQANRAGAARPRRRSAPGTACVVAENLGGGLVDQADVVGGIDHQQALAQVLHDVLRQIGEVREVDVLLPDQAPRSRACGSPGSWRTAAMVNSTDAEQSGGGIDGDVGVAGELLPNGDATARRSRRRRPGTARCAAAAGTPVRRRARATAAPGRCAMPPQACSSSIRHAMSTAAWRIGLDVGAAPGAGAPG